MKVLRSIILVVAFVGTFVPLATAQNASPNFLNVLTVTVHPGKGAVVEDFLVKIKAAAEMTGDSRVVNVAQVSLGGSPNQYLIVTPFNDWAEMDAWATPDEMLVEAYGQDEAMKILEAGTGAVASIENAVNRFRPEFSSTAAAAPARPRYGQVVITDIDPGQQDAYELFLRSVKTAEDKAGVRRIRSSTVQGIASRHIALTLTESHTQRAALPGPPQLLRDEFGAERAHAILEGAQRAVSSRRFQVLELRPELSRTGN